MNYIIRISLALGLSVAAVLIILSSTGHFGLQEQMDVFVAKTIRSALGREVTIEQYVEASMPRNYQRQMNKVPFDRLRPYSPTQLSATQSYTTPWGELMTYTFQMSPFYIQPVPYPPEDLWCVCVKSDDPTVPKVLLIALHQDMYTAHWEVHEPNDVEAVLSAVGCHFSDR